MIACWPGKIPAGKVNNSIVAFQDLMPTVAAITGVQCPQTDGISMMPKLLGTELDNSARTLYWEFPEAGGKQAILKGNMKLMRYFARKIMRYELYNISTDLQEKKNIAAQLPEIIHTLLKEMISMTDGKIPMFRSRFITGAQFIVTSECRLTIYVNNA